MSDAVTITLIVATVVVILLFLFRSSLSSFFFRAGKDGVEGKLETRDPSDPDKRSDTAGAHNHRLEISGNRQMGKNNRIAVDADDVAVRDNAQTGSDQTLDVKQPKSPTQS